MLIRYLITLREILVVYLHRRNGILKQLEQNRIEYLINFIGISIEMGIRPVIWLAEFSKIEKKLYGAIKWADYAYVLYFSQFPAKKLIYFIVKMGLYIWWQAL